MKERTAIENLKLKLKAWSAENQGWSWGKLSKEVEKWTPVVRAPHGYDIRFKWHAPPIRDRIMTALREFIIEKLDASQ